MRPLELLLMEVEMFWSPTPVTGASKNSRRPVPFLVLWEVKEAATGNWESRTGSPSTALAIFTWQKSPPITGCRNSDLTGLSSPSGKVPILDFMAREGLTSVLTTRFMSSIRVAIESLSSAQMARYLRLGQRREWRWTVQ